MDPSDSNLSTPYFPILNMGSNISHEFAAILRKETKVCETIDIILSSEVFNSVYWVQEQNKV